MSCSATLPTLTLTAGQVWDMPITFTDAAGAALDLTGATVYLVAKASLSDEDADAILDITQTTHEDAAAGKSTLPIDLSDLDEVYFSAGGRLTASLWVEDADDHRIPYGLITLEIEPSAKWKPAAP